MTGTTRLLTLLALTAPTAAVATAQHVADYGATNTPNGLSRRAFNAEPTECGWDMPCVLGDESVVGGSPPPPFVINPYRGARTSWNQQFALGSYHFINTDSARFVVADLGTGVGGMKLPAPLVAGGAVNPNGDFGPYSVDAANDFVFEVFFPDLNDYLQQLPYDLPTESDWPEDGAAWGMPDQTKAVGITFELLDSFNVPLQLTLGVYRTAAGPNMVGILDNQGQPFMNVTPTQLQAVPVTDWSLKATVSDTSIMIEVGAGGTYSLATLMASGMDNAAVKSAALRVAGCYSPLDSQGQRVTLRVSCIEITNQNVPEFPPTATPPAPNQDMPWLDRAGSTLFLDYSDLPGTNPGVGVGFQATGVNMSKLFHWFAGFEGTPEYGRHALEQLVEHTDHRVVRFYLFDVGSRYTKVSSAPTGWTSWPVNNFPALDLFEDDEAAFLDALADLVGTASDLGVYLVPSLFPGQGTPLAHVLDVPPDELEPGMIRLVYSDAVTEIPAVLQTRQLIEQIMIKVVRAYKDEPSVLFWEIGNEWDNNVNKELLYPLNNNWEVTWETPQQCAAAMAWVATQIETIGQDQRHLIGTGNAGSASLFLDPITSQQSEAAMHQALDDFIPKEIDLLSLHAYPSNNSSPTNPPKKWAPAPFMTLREYFRGFVEGGLTAAQEDPLDPSRPVYMGEFNAPRRKTFDEDNFRQTLYGELASVPDTSMDPDALEGAAFPLTLQWDWMMMPTEGGYTNPHNVTPDTLLNPPTRAYNCGDTNEDCIVDEPAVPDLRGQMFSEFATDVSAAPRIVAMGYGTTHLTSGATSATIQAYVHDLQGRDDPGFSVQARNVADQSVFALTRLDGGSLWTGPITLSGNEDDYLFEIVATDEDGNVGFHAPWVDMNVTNGTAVSAPDPSVLPHRTWIGFPSELPSIEAAGNLGFDPVTDDSHVWALGLHLTGGDPEVAPLLRGRVNPSGTLGPDSSWATFQGGFPLFDFQDDGKGLDLQAGDGWYVVDEPFDAPSTAPFLGELYVELLAWRGGFSSIWPRLTVSDTAP